jgi:hypothetical protein
MSLGKQKNLIILGAVAAALLAGGVLVADYADVLPGRAKAEERVKPCASGEAKMCCPAAEAETAGFPQVMAATEAAAAQACCGGEKPAGCCPDGVPGESCCGKPCPPDCPKPCCEMPPGGCEKSPAGCRGERQQTEAAGSCCAAKADAATE